MPRLTRRAFLQRSATIATSAAIAACAQLPSAITASTFGPTKLLIWSPIDSADSAIARWRRLNPQIDVQRQAFDSNTLRNRIHGLWQQKSDIPDLIIADNYTIGSVPQLDMLRHIDRPSNNETYVPAAVKQTTRDAQRLFAYPLTVNPLKIWYHSTLLEDALSITNAGELQRAIGTTQDSFASFLQRLNRANPQIVPFASCFDDLVYPTMMQHVAQQTNPRDSIAADMQLATTHIVGQDIHLSGAWFDRLKRQSVAMIVGGRWIGQALQRIESTNENGTWQTISHPLGTPFGPGLVAAIPIQATHFAEAQLFAEELSRSAELQSMICTATQTLPAATVAYTSEALQRVDAILPYSSVVNEWQEALRNDGYTISKAQIITLLDLKMQFYAWQRREISDEVLQQAIAGMPV